MRDLKKIAKVIRSTLTAEFEKLAIEDVRVFEEEDSSGDILLHVEVIFDGAPKDVDVRKLSGAVRHVRPKLTKMGIEAFPLFSFISKSDAGAVGLEPA